MDWPTTAIGGVAIISGVASFTKIVISKRNKKEYKSYQSVPECNRRHDTLHDDIEAIKTSIGEVEKHVAGINGWLERNGKTGN